MRCGSGAPEKPIAPLGEGNLPATCVPARPSEPRGCTLGVRRQRCSNPKNDRQSQQDKISRRVDYQTGKAGGMYVVRLVEVEVDSGGKHSGSIRTVARHDRAADADRNARALRLIEKRSS